MPKIGVSKPFVAKYNWDGKKVTYSEGRLLAKLTELSTTMNSSSDNDFYADNGISETDKEFSDGNGNISVDDLEQDASAMILGLDQTDYTVAESTPVKINHYNNEMTSPDLGFGFIIKRKRKKATTWRAVIFSRIVFSIPAESVKTQTKTIEWQTSALPFTILRDDTETQEWMMDGVFASEEAAFNWIKSILIPATPAA